MTVVNPEIPLRSPELSRRQRVRQATKDELVEAARRLLVEQGLTSVTVRAVAARLGMTAPAIYRYYDSRERLLDDVVDALYDELAVVLEGAVESPQLSSLTHRFMVTSKAFRDWALAHRAEFGLLFGAPVPGVGGKGQDIADPADGVRGMRFMLVWLRLFLEISTSGIELPAWPRPIPAKLRTQLAAYLDRLRLLDLAIPPANFPGVELVLLFLTSWQALYGLICTEAFGHLAFAIEDGDDMFADRLEELRQRLNLP